MKSYKEYMWQVMNEGIIKVDKKLLSFLEAAFAINFLTILEEKLKHKEKIIPIILELKNQYQLNHNTYLDINGIKMSNGNYYDIKYDNNGVIGNFNFYVNGKTMGDDTGAYFKRSNNYGGVNSIYVTLDKDFTLKCNKWLSHPTKLQLVQLIRYKANQIEHELAHLVEWLIINSVKYFKDKQIKNGYNDNKMDYYTSDIEFEPMIISLIRDIELKIKEYYNKTKIPMKVNDYKKLIKDILSGDNYLEVDDAFLFFSKNITPNKYKIAIKKAYVELINNIPEMIKGGYLK